MPSPSLALRVAGHALGALSLLCSALSLLAAQTARSRPPSLPQASGTVVKSVADALAFVGLALALLVVMRGPRWLGLVAGAAAVFVCAGTVSGRM